MLNNFENGYFSDNLTLSDQLKQAVLEKNWGQVDAFCKELVTESGLLFNYLRPYANQKKIEFILSVRDSKNDWEEDGIWHDDGSRVLAFSLGLNPEPAQIKGGELLLRPKGVNEFNSIPPMNFGQIIVFKTGVSGYEHMVKEVTEGHRVVMAGWCYI